MENIDGIRGVYRDILKGSDGSVILDRGWNSNAIVDRCRILLAGFIKNEPSGGIQYLAVGRGDDPWDITGAPAPNAATTTDLENRNSVVIGVGSNLQFAFLDQNDSVVSGATSRLQITATLQPGYPAPLDPLTTYPLREFGLFGRFGTTDYMINVVRHPVIHKDISATLIRVVRLYF